MSFDTPLREVAEQCSDVLGVALVGLDGIPIAQWEASAEGEGEVPEIGSLGVEFGRILAELRKTADSVGGGLPQEAAVRLARFWVVMRSVDDDNFVIASLGPDGNIGRARFALRRIVPSVRDQL